MPGWIKKYVWRGLVYFMGFVIFSLGTALSIKSTLGVTATTSLPVALGTVAGLSTGTMILVMAIVYVIAQMLILQRDFKLINIGQILTGAMMGLLVDGISLLLVGFTVDSYAEKLFVSLISTPIIALGLSMIIQMNLLPSPSEGFSLTVAARIGKPFPKVKVVVDCLTVALAFLLLVAFSHRIEGIREGTVINAIGIGLLIGVFSRLLQPFYAFVNNPCAQLADSEQETISGI